VQSFAPVYLLMPVACGHQSHQLVNQSQNAAAPVKHFYFTLNSKLRRDAYIQML